MCAMYVTFANIYRINAEMISNRRYKWLNVSVCMADRSNDGTGILSGFDGGNYDDDIQRGAGTEDCRLWALAKC